MKLLMVKLKINLKMGKVMSLKTYHKKRDFTKTQEPKGKVVKSRKNKLLYLIQKHAASHLHYDFRLELNGVLLSWAVPKGPCLDPKVKRLAMHVEDHPLDYGSFEGIIPKGQYGGGTVMLWDTGEWISEIEDAEKAYRDGHLSFILKGKKLKGQWKLIRMHKDDKTWLLMKGNDKYAVPLSEYDITQEETNSVKTKRTMDEIAEDANLIWGKKGAKKVARKKKPKKPLVNPILLSHHLPKTFPKNIYPELATLVDKPPVGEKWVHEIKFDGYRLVAFKKNDKVKLVTRNQNDWTQKFISVQEAVENLAYDNLILDGEVVVLDKKHHSNFQLLQNALSEAKEPNFVYYVFDLLYLDQYNLLTLPLLERKKILQAIIPTDHPILKFSDHVEGSGDKIYAKACELGLEGIISKNAKGIYEQKRTKDWLKIKCIKRQEFIIAGFTKPKNSREYFGSLLLATYDENHELVYHGNVGTGFTQASLKEIYQALKKQETSQMPFKIRPPASRDVTWVKPILVAEVEFTEWTSEGQLRHPSFQGMRSDKPAKKIIREKPMPIKKMQPEQKSEKPTSSKIIMSHPEKILYPEGKITKLDIFEYYEMIQDKILPYITNRLLTLVRCPDNYHQCFYQKHLQKNTPAGLFEMTVMDKSGEEEYLYLKNSTGLLSLPQMGVLEIHPWGSTIKHLEKPDMIIFDLDPAPDVTWKKVVKGAFEIRKYLAELDLISFVKTTGGKGLHVVVPIKPQYEWEEVKEFTHAFVDIIVAQSPELYVGKMSKEKRKGKIFLDYLRNQRGATAVAPYSTRAREKAPVSTPVHWDELTGSIKDTFFTIKTLEKHLQTQKHDPWEDFFKISQKLNLSKFK